MDMTIKEALAQLDPMVDEHWTADGLPRMDVVEGLVGTKEITRQDVTEADPEFCREEALNRAAEAEENDDDASAQVQERQEEGQGEVVTKLDLDQQIQDMDAEITSLQKARDDVARERDRLQQAEYGGHTAADDTKARLAYIRKQHELRLERAGRRAEIFKQLQPGDISKGSQLDAAMSRKTARGTQRPNRPPL